MILCVIGGQYGSEGKGTIVYHLANRYPVHVRVGGPNAGHTIYHNGRLWKMRSVPVGWVNKDAMLFIGAGACVDLEVFLSELAQLSCEDKSVPFRLRIDYRAGIITKEHREFEKNAGLGDAVSSTLEGVGACRMARIARGAISGLVFRRAADYEDILRKAGVTVADTAVELGALAKTSNILLEGTQGSGLSLLFGEWPYVTSHDVSVSQLLADVGLPPRNIEVCMVLRTYPIRVGGNSGPLPNEISWEELSRRLGKKVEEFTTVTGKLRRVAMFDIQQVMRAVELNLPDCIALNFVDYLDPACEGVTDYEALTPTVKHFINWVERVTGVPVKLIGTGRRDIHGFCVIER